MFRMWGAGGGGAVRYLPGHQEENGTVVWEGRGAIPLLGCQEDSGEGRNLQREGRRGCRF